MSEPLWEPSPELISNSNITSFIRYVEQLTNTSIKNYEELYDWSIKNIEEFWKSIWVISGIIHSKEFDEVLDKKIMPGAKWFNGAKLNFAENLLRFKDDKVAIVSTRENLPRVELTYNQLYKNVAALSKYLKSVGVKKGDRVAGFVTNIAEAIIAMLATTSIGAIWSSTSPDFGLKGVLDRFGQIQPKVLFAIEKYSYNGKEIDCTNKIKHITENIPEIEKVILIPEYNNFEKLEKSKIYNATGITNSIYLNEILKEQIDNIEFEQLPFDHPVYIMYSSGTTGIPKCIVHGAGGTLLQHFKEHSLHTNLKRDDKITYFTTCGWMMWNWLVSSLFIGATVFLYDGSPAYPNVKTLWKKIEEEKINIFGTSPKFLTICQKSELVPKKEFDLSSLNSILSTGSPLTVENFNWVYENVKNDLMLSSISGGTDIISCFMLGCPIKPVYSGEIQSRGLGMKVEAFDENGNSIISEKGELVCTAPFPSMPVAFWNDKNNEKYKSAYFEHFPGVWRHGDFIKITENGGVIVYGRSDATLNPGGVRIGTAEIYRIVEALDEIQDSIVVGQNWKNDIRVILFVVLRDGFDFTKELADKIKSQIRNQASPRHVPAKILEVQDIPRTISGKKVELAVKNIIEKNEVLNKDALSNPKSLKYFKNRNELES